MFKYKITFAVALKKGIVNHNVDVPFTFESLCTEKFREWLEENNIHYDIRISFLEHMLFIFNTEEDLSHFILRWC